MNYYRIKSKEDQPYGNCLHIAKLYEDYYFNGNRKASNIILDDAHNKVIVKDEIEYTLTPDIYLALYNELVEYRKALWEQE